jgi:hypothetical protein
MTAVERSRPNPSRRHSGEPRKRPTRLEVPDQSIEVLVALLEQPGELVTSSRQS